MLVGQYNPPICAFDSCGTSPQREAHKGPFGVVREIAVIKTHARVTKIECSFQMEMSIPVGLFLMNIHDQIHKYECLSFSMHRSKMNTIRANCTSNLRTFGDTADERG